MFKKKTKHIFSNILKFLWDNGIYFRNVNLEVYSWVKAVKEKIIFMGTLYFHFLPNDKPGIKEL